MPSFDPEFDDARWTLDWAKTPILQVPIGAHPDGYVVVERLLTRAQIFDRFYAAREPFPVRALLDPSGALWMSDTPQERMMMFNNAQASRGRILVGGLGLAMYPQYAAPRAEHFTIVERSRAVIDIVGPTLEHALGGRINLDIVEGDVSEFLAAEPAARYDTIFLDTWDTLDAKHLPHINRLRDRAIRRLAPEGRVLPWGYRWMVRLFEDACHQLLSVPPDDREVWLAGFNQPEAAALLRPVMARFGGVSFDQAALQWCREYIVSTWEVGW